MLIKAVETQNEQEDAFKVRHRVFVHEQKVPEDLEIDQHEDEATHFVAYDQQKPIAAGRYRIVDGFAKLERICVLKDYRGTGIGKLLMNEIEKQAGKKGVSGLKLNSQVSAIDFYKSLGYEITSSEFMDAGIPHVTMIKKL
ncbi:GNAT family N-acetyltransferase [Guptibacillus algicola]|uniref:GNAT family N-acetyltransferase n=1 Tax=Guptibacillus algicola TaxID=225844 RepID=UPI001CD7BCDA|nr:GNAT family N-acetyltransferase [Alkalihalobacillus algicola]MCA0987868.1 GNAT family N-acetyltransferase [Alkalihalobacillus algicola]